MSGGGDALPYHNHAVAVAQREVSFPIGVKGAVKVENPALFHRSVKDDPVGSLMVAFFKCSLHQA